MNYKKIAAELLESIEEICYQEFSMTVLDLRRKSFGNYGDFSEETTNFIIEKQKKQVD